LEWLRPARDNVITQREAAEKIGVSDRWCLGIPRRSYEVLRYSRSRREMGFAVIQPNLPINVLKSID
jgi:hypothetical protein